MLQVIKMLMMVVVTFSICWLPWQSYFLISTVYPAINQ
jgi:tachykinin-like receptor